MNIVKLLFSMLLIIFSTYFCDSFAQTRNYDFKNWPGKNGTIKCDIEFPDLVISKYNLTLSKGSKAHSIYFKIPLDENDSIKKGRLQIDVFSSTLEAQIALVDFLDCLTTINKPQRIMNASFIKGDVVFGQLTDGVFWGALTKNNILIIINAPEKAAIEIVDYLDSKIEIAPKWSLDNIKPSFRIKCFN